MADVDKLTRAYTEQLRGQLADRLVSVVLYGSAARGDYRDGVSDINLAVIVDRVDPPLLRDLNPLAREWAEQGNPPPLLFGREEWYGSADVFPIEYSDIQSAHRVLHGVDPFDGVTVDREHLRLQAEHELKSKQLQLRERFLLVSQDPEQVGGLLVAALPTFLTLFRTTLRLADEEVPRDPRAVIQTAASRFGWKPDAMLRIEAARSDAQVPKLAADDPVVVGYFDAVDRTAAWLDLG